MTRFDRHVLARFFAALALLTALLVAIFVVLDYAEYVDDFLDRGATMREVFGTYYLNYLPEIVRLTSPLAVFLAAIYVTARLSQSLQLTALRAAGVSMHRYMVPLAGAGAAIATGMFFFNGYLVPRTNAVVHAFQNQYYRDAPETLGGEEVYRQTAPGQVLGVGYFDREAQRGYRISLFQLAQDTVRGERRLVARLDAADMEWTDSLGVWRLREAALRRFPPEGPGTVETFVQLDTALSVRPRDLAQSERDAQRLTIPEARDFVDALARAGVTNRGRPLVEYFEKFSYPTANFILMLIAVPLAARRRKGGQAVQLGLGLAVAFVYLALQRVTLPFGYAETIPPVVAAWLPHAVFWAVAVLLLARMR
ncbi:MAG: LptF/LptG family permease [Rubricoccaceae bacterium]